MSTTPIEFIAPRAATAPWDAPGDIFLDRASEAAPSAFANWFTQQLNRVNGELAVADQHLQSLAMGETQNLHQVMISLEEARLSFQLLMQVRNRALEAYQEVMRMQV